MIRPYLQHFSRNNGNEVQVEEHKVQSSAAEKASKYDVSTSEEEGEESGAAENGVRQAVVNVIELPGN